VFLSPSVASVRALLAERHVLALLDHDLPLRSLANDAEELLFQALQPWVWHFSAGGGLKSEKLGLVLLLLLLRSDGSLRVVEVFSDHVEAQFL